MKKVIISGAGGFIGSALARLCIKEGLEVLAFGKRDRNKVNPLRLPQNTKLTYLKLDMKDIEKLPQLL